MLPQPSKQQLLPPPIPESQSPPDELNVKFKIDRIEVVGSTIFTPKDFATVTSSFVGRELTFAELLQIKELKLSHQPDQAMEATST